MAPPLTSCRITSQAPTPSMAVCTKSRTNFAAPWIAAARSLASDCMESASWLNPAQRRRTPSVRPMASITSALRRAPSTVRMLRVADRFASRSGRLAASIAGESEQEQDHGAGQRHMPHQGVQQIDDGEIDRDPGNIEQRCDRRSRGTCGRTEIPQAFALVVALAETGVERPAEGERADAPFQPGGDPIEHAAAQGVEQTRSSSARAAMIVRYRQGFDASRGQDAVVDLKHVDGRGQHQDVQHGAEQHHSRQGAPAPTESIGQNIILRHGVPLPKNEDPPAGIRRAGQGLTRRSSRSGPVTRRSAG